MLRASSFPSSLHAYKQLCVCVSGVCVVHVVCGAHGRGGGYREEGEKDKENKPRRTKQGGEKRTEK